MKPLRLKRPEPLETQVLKTVLRALELHPDVAKAWRMNSGAGQLKRANGFSQYIKFGVVGGADIWGHMKDGRALYVEVKRPSGVVSPEQMEFIQQAKKYGCVAFVARSADCVFSELGGSNVAKT